MVDLGGSRSIVRIACVALVLAFVSCQSVDNSTDGKIWGEPVEIETLQTGALRPRVAIDPMRNAVAIWDQSDPATRPPDVAADDSDDLWWNRCCSDEGQWGAQERIDSTEVNEPGDSVYAQIGIDDDGVAVVAFLQFDGTHFRVWALRRDLYGDFREEPRCIQSTADDSDCSQLVPVGDVGPPPQLAVDAEGNAVVVWQQGGAENENTSVWLNRSAAGLPWGDAEEVERKDVRDLLKPAAAMDSQATAILVWERLDRDTRHSSIWTTRQTRDGVWDEVQPLDETKGNAFEPRVAANPQGNDAIAVWTQQETPGAPCLVYDYRQETSGPPCFIYASRFVASPGSWDPPEPIGTDSGENEERPQVAMDAEGNAIAVWIATQGGATGVFSNRYDVGAGWGTAARIGPRDLGPARSPQVAVNAAGEAVAVWVQFDGVQDRIWSNRYTPRRGWASSEAISNLLENPFDRAAGPHAAIDAEGFAVAVWVEGAGSTWGLLANRQVTQATRSDTR